jgi:hypothetical protein
MKKILSIVLLCCMVSFTTNCAFNPKPVAGTVNQFDSDAYLYLVTTDSLIKETEADLTNGVFAVNLVPKIKTALNILIKSYNTANTTYLSYHTAALNGVATVTQQAAVSSTIADVKSSTSALANVKGGK